MEISDFLRQVPAGILLAPILFGVAYIILTVHIFRRAAARRRQKRLEAGLEPGPPKRSGFSFGGILRGESAERPAELVGLPEPDLDMLVTPVALDQQEANPAANSASPSPPDPTEALIASGADWIAAVTPQTAPSAGIIDLDKGTDMTPESAEPGDAVEVMRVWRDLSDGSLIIQMGNQRYRTLAEIQNQDLARRFAAVVRELWTLVNNAPTRSTGTQPPAAADSTTAAPPPARKMRPGLLSTPEPDQKPGLLKQMARQAIGQSSTQKPEEPAGIANAVEDYLQFKLSSTPEYASRSIHIRTSHDHGVRIEVDGHYYDAIGDVVDPDVREFLFAMMREWEARH
jgi:hypothetical protein